MQTDQIAGGMPFEDIDPTPFGAMTYPEVPKKKKRRRSDLRLDLTDELIKAFPPPYSEAWLRDLQSDLAVRLRCSGSNAFYLLLDSDKPLHPDADGQVARREFLGSVEDYTVAEARKKAGWAKTAISADRRKPRLRRDMWIRAIVDEYLKEHNPRDSEWFVTTETLLRNYLVPKFGDNFLAGVQKDQWLLLIDKVALEKQSRGSNLLKVLKAFLWWSVRRGLLHANPLAREKLEIPALRHAVHLDAPELAIICEVGKQLGKPWSTMLGLVVFTGEAIEDVRQIQSRDIDWENSKWAVERVKEPGCISTPKREVLLAAEAMALLKGYEDIVGYLFPSPRLLSATPINFYSEIIEHLRAISHVPKEWGMRDVRCAAQREIARRGQGEAALKAWAHDLSAEIEAYRSKIEGTDVVL